MDRREAIAFNKKYAHKQFYQPVVFVPEIIEIRGKWNLSTKQLATDIFQSIHGKSVLDLGCNIGFFVREALRFGASKAIGVDYDPVEISIAKEISKITGDNAEFILSNLEDFYSVTTFDIVLLLNVLHTVQDPNKVVEKALSLGSTVIVEHDTDMILSKISIKQEKSPRCSPHRIISIIQ